MALEAMFVCDYTKKGRPYSGPDDPAIDLEVELQAVTGDGSEDDPNASWSKWTPSGRIEMQITNPAAEGFFEPGEDYRVVITKRQPQKART